MKVTITTVKAYKVTINGKNAGIFHEESSWEGMKKLVNSEKQSLIVGQENLLSEMMADVFNTSMDAPVIAASRKLRDMFEVKENQ